MLEWLAWEPKHILGVSKNAYRKLIVEWSHENSVLKKPIENKICHVKKKHEYESREHEQTDRYSSQNKGIASAREAVRRAKYFSENYLNKEFDIFWALVSDRYLHEFYGQYTELNGQGTWYTHGKNMMFERSTDIANMQMDNLAYNPEERILVANELKLGGKKNNDQILKYARMFDLLRKGDFILDDTRFLLLFFGRNQDHNWDAAIKKELMYCKKSKGTKKNSYLIKQRNIEVAKSAEYGTNTWKDLMSFNDAYLKKLNTKTQQVEIKLLTGFNHTLFEKFEIEKENSAAKSER